MIAESEFKSESFRLVGGGSTYALVHIATGLLVAEAEPSDRLVVERWAVLQAKMAELLQSPAD